jgi:hypothetical protein
MKNPQDWEKSSVTTGFKAKKATPKCSALVASGSMKNARDITTIEIPEVRPLVLE